MKNKLPQRTQRSTKKKLTTDLHKLTQISFPPWRGIKGEELMKSSLLNPSGKYGKFLKRESDHLSPHSLALPQESLSGHSCERENLCIKF